jgi:hypothetical protein
MKNSTNTKNAVQTNFEFLGKKDNEIMLNKMGFSVSLVAAGLVNVGAILDHTGARLDDSGAALLNAKGDPIIDSACNGYEQIKGFVKDFIKPMAELEYLPKSTLNIDTTKPAQYAAYGKHLLNGANKKAFMTRFEAMNGDEIAARLIHTKLLARPTLEGFEGDADNAPVPPAEVLAHMQELVQDETAAYYMEAAKNSVANTESQRRLDAIEVAEAALLKAQNMGTSGESPAKTPTAPTAPTIASELSDLLEAVTVDRDAVVKAALRSLKLEYTPEQLSDIAKVMLALTPANQPEPAH